MSNQTERFTLANVAAARDSLRASILHLSPKIQAWPRKVLTTGTDAEIVRFANTLCRSTRKSQSE